MWVWVFPHHSCQKLIKSLVFDSWFDKIFWDLWCGKSHTHISSSQYSLTTVQKIWMGKTTTIQEFWLTIKKWEVVEWVLYSIFLSHTDEFCKDATRVCGYEKIKTNYFSDTLEQLSFTDIVKKNTTTYFYSYAWNFLGKLMSIWTLILPTSLDSPWQLAPTFTWSIYSTIFEPTVISPLLPQPSLN